MERILQKIQIFKFWWQGLSLFGQKLPLVLASALFVVLVFHISFEVWEIVCKAIRIGASLSEIIMTILKQTIRKIGSDTIRNLSLLLAASIGWFFFYWRAKTADQDVKIARQNAKTAEKVLTAEQITRAIEQLAHKKPSVRLGGILGLEQIADAHKEERTKIMQILSVRIRELAPLDYTRRDEGLYDRPDIKSAIEVLAKIAEPFGREKIEFCQLYRTNLGNLHFSKINLSYFNFRYANFSRTSFVNVDFDETQMDRANVSSAFFHRITGTVAAPIANLKPFYLEGHPPIDLNTLPDGLNPEERETLPEDD